MLSSKMMQPGFSSADRTRPSSTCSLKAITRSVVSPPLVTRPAPMRMRLPLAPSTLRAGGRISAGMISVVQMPLPICAAIAPSDWPHFCAPSPESLMISMMCSFSVVTGVVPETGVGAADAGLPGSRGAFEVDFFKVVVVMIIS